MVLLVAACGSACVIVSRSSLSRCCGEEEYRGGASEPAELGDECRADQRFVLRASHRFCGGEGLVPPDWVFLAATGDNPSMALPFSGRESATVAVCLAGKVAVS